MGRIVWAGAVLAGGASRRMGFPKADLLLSGQRLLDRQLQLLRDAGAARCLVSVHPERNLIPPLHADVMVVEDALPQAGPLAGLTRILETLTEEFAVVLAVDLPEMSTDFLLHLIGRSSWKCGVIPSRHGSLEPLAATYPRSACAVAQAQLAAGDYRLQHFAQIGIRDGWMQAWEPEPSLWPSLTNWNSPEDYPVRERASLRAAEA